MTIKKLSEIIKDVNKENEPPNGWPSDKEWNEEEVAKEEAAKNLKKIESHEIAWQLNRVANALEEVLRLVKEDQERTRKYMEEKKDIIEGND